MNSLTVKNFPSTIFLFIFLFFPFFVYGQDLPKVVTIQQIATSSLTATTPQITEKLYVSGCQVYSVSKKLSKEEVFSIMNNMEALKMYKKGMLRNSCGNAFLWIGSGMLICTPMPLIGVVNSDNAADENTYQKAGLMLLGGGIACILTGLIVKSTGRYPVRKSVDMYNNSAKSTSMELRFGITGNGIGLALSF